MDSQARKCGRDEGSSVDIPRPSKVCTPLPSSITLISACGQSDLNIPPPAGLCGKRTPMRSRSASNTRYSTINSPFTGHRRIGSPDKRISSPNQIRGNSLLKPQTPQKTSTPLLVSGSRTDLHIQQRESTPSRHLERKSSVMAYLDADKDDEILELNFSYTNEFRPQRYDAKTNEPVVEATNTPSSSTEDTAQLIYKFRRRMKKPKHEADFTKYIPIPIPVSLHVPKLFLNQMDPKEWLEAQEAYERDRVEDVKRSGSETRLDETKAHVVPGTSNKSVKCLPMRCSGSSTSKAKHKEREFQPLEEFYFNYLKPRRNVPRRMNSRYDLDKAELLIQTNITHNPSYSAVLYVALSQTPNFGLCHAMTELCVSAMLTFFHPYRDVRCLWVEDMQGKLVNLLADHGLKPRFTRLVYLRKFDAILVLSEDASNLLRHKDVCFLHSVTSSLKIQPHKLLVLCREGSSAAVSPSRPVTAQW